MTHGDKAKAKTGKSSQASASKKGSTQKAGSAAASSKGARKEAGRESKAGKAAAPHLSVKKGSPAKAAPPEKRVAAPAPKATGGDKPARPVGGNGNGAFSNPLIAAAFKHAVKKYSNAFRKLTD